MSVCVCLCVYAVKTQWQDQEYHFVNVQCKAGTERSVEAGQRCSRILWVCFAVKLKKKKKKSGGGGKGVGGEGG